MSCPKSLLQVLSYKEASNLSLETCEKIAKFAKIKIPQNNSNKTPGELLLKYLDRSGCTLEQYKFYLNIACKQSYYSPQSKVAILIANESYQHLSRLGTPCIDCECLGSTLRNLGFITVIVRNTKGDTLKEVISKTISLLAEDSYCFIYYGGHGCELNNTKCILSIDCPITCIEFNHCVTENWLLRETSKCKPELCVLIMDMCRSNLERDMNPGIYEAISNIEEYTIHSNLLISYSTSNIAYEIGIVKGDEANCNSYELSTMEEVLGGGSPYAIALCSRLTETVDISTVLDRVHRDLEDTIKKQRPIKVQCGVAKRFLHDPVTGDTNELLASIREGLRQYKKFCSVY